MAYSPAPVMIHDGLTASDITKLKPWHAALANRHFIPAKALYIGDSQVEGEGATTRANRSVDRLTNFLRNRFPTDGIGTGGGVGYLAPYWQSPTLGQPWATLTGTTPGTDTTLGLGRRTALLTTTKAYNYTALTATSIDVFYSRGSGTGTISTSVDSGTAVTLATVNGSTLSGSFTTLSGLGGTAHTLSVTASAGTAYFEGLRILNGDESKGIHVYDSGHYGFKASDWITSTNYFPRAFSQVGADLIVLQLGVNDYAANRTAAAYKADMVTLIALIRAAFTTAPPILLVAQALRGGTFTGGAWPEYVAAMKELSTGDSAMAFLDLSAIVPAQATDTLSLWNDATHYTNKGHGYTADLIGRAISPH